MAFEQGLTSGCSRTHWLESECTFAFLFHSIRTFLHAGCILVWRQMLAFLFSTDILVYLTSFFSLLLISDIRLCTFLKLCFIDTPWSIVLLILSYLFCITPSIYQANKALPSYLHKVCRSATTFIIRWSTGRYIILAALFDHVTT